MQKECHGALAAWLHPAAGRFTRGDGSGFGTDNMLDDGTAKPTGTTQGESHPGAPRDSTPRHSGTDVAPRQERAGAQLQQSVEVHRRDGSVWTAYDRQIALPEDPAEADQATGRASCVLALLAQAVAATHAAREARGAMLGGEAPPWEVHYGEPARSGQPPQGSQGAPWSC